MIARHGGNCPCIPPKQKKTKKRGQGRWNCGIERFGTKTGIMNLKF
jgi:hypothetical protein